MKLRRLRSSSRIRPMAERLEDRSLMNVDFRLAFPINGVATNASIQAVAGDAFGNQYVAGEFQGTVQFGGTGPSSILTAQGTTDGFVAKYSPQGVRIWSLDARIAAGQGGAAFGVAADSAGDAYVVGTYTGSVSLGTFTLTSSTLAGFAAKIDPAGNVLWATNLVSDTSLTPFGVAVDGSDNVYVVGEFQGTALSGTLVSAGGQDAFLAKLLPNGNLVSDLHMGGTGADRAVGVAADNSGNAYVTGFFSGTATFGSTTLVSAGGSDGFVAKVNSAASVAWAKGLGGSSNDQGIGVGVDAFGNVYATGQAAGSATFGPGVTLPAGAASAFALKYDPLGNLAWAHVLPTTGAGTAGLALAVDPPGNVYVSGNGSGTVNFDTGPTGYNVTLTGTQGFVWKLDANGRFQWARTVGGPGASRALVAVGAQGKVVVAGSYNNGAVQLGTQSLADSAGGGKTNSFVSVLAPPVAGDYDGDGRTDLALLRPPISEWLLRFSSTGAGFPLQFGAPGDIPVPGNYLGSGATEVAVYRPSTAQWFIPGIGAVQFGQPNVDQPVPGDYDGDGKTDIAVYRPGTAQWFILRSTLGPEAIQFGGPGDQPVPADYDGDGKTDIATYRSSTAQWFVLGSTSGPFPVSFGAPNLDVPIPGDYTGSGRANFAVYRPGTAQWLIGGFGAFTFGAPDGDLPVPGDYAGLGRSLLAVYRPGTGQWFVQGLGVFGFGQPGVDLPTQLPVAYRAGFFGRSAARSASIAAAGEPDSAALVIIDPSAEAPAGSKRKAQI